MIPNHNPTLDFGLGESADMIRETTARFAADRIAPLAAEIDATNTFPRHLWPQMGELGHTASPSRKTSAALAWAIWSMWSPPKRCLAPRPQLGSATGLTPTSA